MAHHGEYAYTNQSVNGLLNRLVGNTSVGNTYPAYNSFVYLSTVISSAILVGSAMFYRIRSNVIGVVDFLIAGLTFTFASPIVWDHHLGILPACFAVLLVTIEGMAPSRKRDLFAIILAMSYSLSTYPLRTFLAHPTGWFSILQSTMFLGASGVLFLLYAVRDGVEPGEPQLHRS
jgi:alpha-1,2-mannosyltransferase